MSDELSEDFAPDALEAAGALRQYPDPGYIWPSDPRTLAALEKWRDHKVGVIIHWGIFSHIGQDGSWSLHRQRLGGFTDPPEDWTGTDEEYHSWYCDQARSFTGEDFNAEEWASACAKAGMRYLVFTTKHHDGYAMYDSDFTNFKSTSEDAGLGRDIVREMFDAFRAYNLETGVYFSKADWNHPGYWDRARTITDRYHNFDIETHRAKWDSFVRYTHNQIDELLRNYGKVNVLWLDAGWVREPDEPIDIDQIAEHARELQPEILVVDREVHGVNENYRTPEQEIPDDIRLYPWESCITMTRGWCSMRPEEPIKPMRHIISNLLAIVSRGGNYLIGIGPDAQGRMSSWIGRGLEQLGDFLRVNGEGIYSTRPWLDIDQVTGEDGWSWYATRPKADNQRVFFFGMPPASPSDEATELSLEEATFAPAGLASTWLEVPGKVLEARILGSAEPVIVENREGSSRLVIPQTDLRYAVGVELTF